MCVRHGLSAPLLKQAAKLSLRAAHPVLCLLWPGTGKSTADTNDLELPGRHGQHHGLLGRDYSLPVERAPSSASQHDRSTFSSGKSVFVGLGPTAVIDSMSRQGNHYLAAATLSFVADVIDKISSPN